jgi:DNA-binding GntR family transcriptional regulator
VESGDPGIYELNVVPVDLSSPVPAYVQLEQELRRQIQASGDRYGARLPPEPTLARLYGVSRVTLRQALERLADAGLISRRQGIGTIITPVAEVTLDLRPMESVTHQLKQAGYQTHVANIEQRVGVPPEPVTTELKLSTGEAGVLIRRLLAVNGAPVSIIASWLPCRLFPGLESVSLSSAEDSLWTVLAQRYQRAPARGKNTFEVISSTVQESELLKVGFGAPLIKLVCVFTDAAQAPIEYSTALWITNRVRLHF